MSLLSTSKNSYVRPLQLLRPFSNASIERRIVSPALSCRVLMRATFITGILAVPGHKRASLQVWQTT
jgi:hypothetical protein